MKKTLMLGSAVLALTALLAGAAVGTGADQNATYQQLSLLTEALSIVRKQYVDEIPLPDLVLSAVKGAVSGLDPDSTFLDPDAYREIEAGTASRLAGVGMETTLRNDTLTVVAAIYGTPGQRAGLRTDDRIVKIDGVATTDMQPAEAARRLRGAPGTEVSVTVVREGWAEPRDIRLTREAPGRSVEIRDLGSGVGYVRLSDFEGKTPSELGAGLEDLSGKGAKGLVLDLRDNPGGPLPTAIEVAGTFLERGRLVVSTESRLPDHRKRFEADAKTVYDSIPLVVLVDHGTAASAEVVAGALQDWHRALLVGTPTFGKGSVQTVIPLSDGSAIRLTTARFLTPNGRTIQRKGIAPDIVVEAVRDKEAAPGAGTGPDHDPQLERALEIVKGMQVIERLRHAGGRPAEASSTRS